MSQAKVKGANIINWRTFVDRQGNDVWSAMISSLTPSDRDELMGLNSMSWYEVSLQNRVLEALVEHLPGSENEVLMRLTEFEARQDLTVVHRMFLRMANPAFMVEQGARLWGRFYDRGKWTSERVENGARSSLSDFGHIERIFVPYLGHYFLNAFTLVGAKDADVTWRLVGDVAHFEGTWRG